jgi:hypothetical protein
MRTFIAAAVLAAAFALADAAQAQSGAALDLESAAGDVGQGWQKKSGTGEGVTYVCDADSCGGRGVLGVSQATASGDYVKLVIADPDKALATYKYGSEESMKATGCAFKSYDVKRQGKTRVLYESLGACPDGSAASMTTIFDVDRPNIMSVQVLTKTQHVALSLRDRIAGNVVAALDEASIQGR